MADYSLLTKTLVIYLPRTHAQPFIVTHSLAQAALQMHTHYMKLALIRWQMHQKSVFGV